MEKRAVEKQIFIERHKNIHRDGYGDVNKNPATWTHAGAEVKS